MQLTVQQNVISMAAPRHLPGEARFAKNSQGQVCR